MKNVSRYLGLIILFSLILSFQNCSGFESQKVLDSFLGASGISRCDLSLQKQFENSFYRTAQEQSCNNCHTSDQSKGSAFADNKMALAFDAFISMGAANTFNRYAIGNHQLGYTGPHLKVDLENNTEVWNRAVTNFYECVEDKNTDNMQQSQVQLISLLDNNNQPINNSAPVNMIWRLEDQLFTDALTGSEFHIDISLEVVDGVLSYSFTNLRFIAGLRNLEFEDITLFINGEQIWTYSFGLQEVNAGSQAVLSTQPVLYSPQTGSIKNTDQISIGFYNLQEL